MSFYVQKCRSVLNLKEKSLKTEERKVTLIIKPSVKSSNRAECWLRIGESRKQIANHLCQDQNILSYYTFALGYGLSNTFQSNKTTQMYGTLFLDVLHRSSNFLGELQKLPMGTWRPIFPWSHDDDIVCSGCVPLCLDGLNIYHVS